MRIGSGRADITSFDRNVSPGLDNPRRRSEQHRGDRANTRRIHWLGTDTGPFRFDGKSFERYHHTSGEDLLPTTIPSLMATSDGGLWIGYAAAGASYLKDGYNMRTREPECGVHLIVSPATNPVSPGRQATPRCGEWKDCGGKGATLPGDNSQITLQTCSWIVAIHFGSAPEARFCISPSARGASR
jgi:hypothetical protein